MSKLSDIDRKNLYIKMILESDKFPPYSAVVQILSKALLKLTTDELAVLDILVSSKLGEYTPNSDR